MKIATTIDEQLKLLEDRGMLLDEGRNKAREELLDIGYFRLGFYCFPFEQNYPNAQNRNHQYAGGSKFSDVIKLYYLDSDLRNILLKFLCRIEVNFRTKVIYHISNAYKGSPTWFIDSGIVEKAYVDEFDEKVYTKSFKNTNKVIKHHHQKYINDKYAPAWKTLEYMTFGAIVKLLKSVKDQNVVAEISRQYGINNPTMFFMYMKCIVDIRNVCSHGGILFDYMLPLSLKSGPALTITSNQNKNNLYAIIQVVIFFLKSISTNRANELNDAVIAKLNGHKNNNAIANIAKAKIGYLYP